ncbi:MAG: DUF1700 domain-containing protein [Clostridium sp.]
MNKNEFLSIIKDGLKDFPEQELNDIIYDYEEHFFSAMEAGKSEEEIVNELGDPYVIVNGYRNGYLQKNDVKEEEKEEFKYDSYENNTKYSKSSNSGVDVNKILKIIIAGLLVILIGPLFLGLGLGAIGVLFTILVAVIVVPFSLSLAGIAVIFSALFNHTLGFITVPNFIADFPMSVIVLGTVGSIALSLLTIIIAYYILKSIFVGIKNLIIRFNQRGRA